MQRQSSSGFYLSDDKKRDTASLKKASMASVLAKSVGKLTVKKTWHVSHLCSSPSALPNAMF